MRIVIVVAVLIISIVIPLGAFTRLSDAGLGCPDWPVCYGYIDFRDSMAHVKQVNEAEPGSLREAHKTWPEMVHRYFASSLGLFILAIAIAAFIRRNKPDHWGKLPYLLFILVCFQGLLGMWTVTMRLYPPTVVGHLFGGFFTFTLLCLLALRVFGWEQKSPEASLARYRYLALTAFFVLLLQIGLGGWMSANYAALVCTELPICEPGWMQKISFLEAFSAPYDASVDYEFGILSHEARTTIHILHRLFAMIASILILAVLALVWREAKSQHTRHLLIAILALLIVQVGLGLSNIIFVLPIAVATAHNGVAAVLMAALAYLCTQTFRANSLR